MITKNISLARFYIDCILAFFKPSFRWRLQTPFRLLERMFYYFCNWCYFLFLNNIEYLTFMKHESLIAIEKNLYARYFYPSQFWIALTEGLKIQGPETLYRLTYGETSWFGIHSILKGLHVSSEDIFYDLGCGTGRNVFFAHAMYGVKAVGIDLIGTFVENGNAVAQEMNLDKVAFLEQDIFKTDISEATIVFVTANCFDQECMALLSQKMFELAPGTQVISTARVIPSPAIQLTHTQKLLFSWGIDTVYFHKRLAV